MTNADDLLRDLDRKIDSIDDLVERNKAVSGWLLASRDDLRGIYVDESVFANLETETALDLDDMSHADIIKSLRQKVSERIAALKDIRQQTREHDVKS